MTYRKIVRGLLVAATFFIIGGIRESQAAMMGYVCAYSYSPATDKVSLVMNSLPNCEGTTLFTGVQIYGPGAIGGNTSYYFTESQLNSVQEQLCQYATNGKKISISTTGVSPYQITILQFRTD